MQIVIGLTRVDNNDLDILIDLKNKLYHEYYRCLSNNLVKNSSGLLYALANFVEQRINDLIDEMQIPPFEEKKLKQFKKLRH